VGSPLFSLEHDPVTTDPVTGEAPVLPSWQIYDRCKTRALE